MWPALASPCRQALPRNLLDLSGATSSWDSVASEDVGEAHVSTSPQSPCYTTWCCALVFSSVDLDSLELWVSTLVSH